MQLRGYRKAICSIHWAWTAPLTLFLSPHWQEEFAGVHLWVLCSKVRISPSEKSNSSGYRSGSSQLRSSENSSSSSLETGLLAPFLRESSKKSPLNTEQSHSILQQTGKAARPGPRPGCHHLIRDKPDPDFHKAKLRGSRRTLVALKPQVSWSKSEVFSPSVSELPLLRLFQDTSQPCPAT